jgi:hypothetical protein
VCWSSYGPAMLRVPGRHSIADPAALLLQRFRVSDVVGKTGVAADIGQRCCCRPTWSRRTPVRRRVCRGNLRNPRQTPRATRSLRQEPDVWDRIHDREDLSAAARQTLRAVVALCALSSPPEIRAWLTRADAQTWAAAGTRPVIRTGIVDSVWNCGQRHATQAVRPPRRRAASLVRPDRCWASSRGLIGVWIRDSGLRNAFLIRMSFILLRVEVSQGVGDRSGHCRMV